MMTRLLLVTASAGMLLFASGCKTIVASCHKTQAYTEAGELPPLRVPVGLDGLDTSRAMEIPELDQPLVPRGPGARCLEEPPIITASTLEPDAALEERRGDRQQGERRRNLPPLPR